MSEIKTIQYAPLDDKNSDKNNGWYWRDNKPCKENELSNNCGL